jgi:hypothetical protein
MPFHNLMCYSNLAERLRRRRSSVEMNMSVYPGDLLIQDPHKKLLKRNTISDFYPNKNGSTLTEGMLLLI